jgi:hypothetical protein
MTEQQQQHPITPPPELVEQWASMSPKNDAVQQNWIEIATQAAQWGADQELEACCDWLHWQNLATHSELIPSLCAARRPKLPPSLKEQALDELYLSYDKGYLKEGAADTIRRALEALND